MPTIQKRIILLWKELHILFNFFDGFGFEGNMTLELKQW